MDQETFMEDCLEAHQELLTLERRVHDWICGLAGIEVVGEKDGPLPWQKPEWNEHHPAAPAAEAEAGYGEPLDAAPDTIAPPAEAGLGEPLEFAAEGEVWEVVEEAPAWDQGEADAPERMARENRPPRPAHDEAAEPKRRVESDNPWAE